MRRYVLQLAALLLVAIAGTAVYWRTTITHNASSTTAARPVATAAPGSPGRTTAAHAPAAYQVAVSWPGNTAQYLGRYRLTASTDLDLAQTGMLTIFMRTVPHEPRPVLSGILALNGTNQDNVLYLTHFEHSGPKLSTSVNLGIYTGPVLGRFVVTAHDSHAMSASLLATGQAPLQFTFQHFSRNPHP